MSAPQVTILLPNYRTPRLTKLCLHLLRKHTDPRMYHVIVIDNNSRDESLEYLKRLPWIELIERVPPSDETPSLSHSRALDLGLERVTTPYVLSMHTDTLVRHPSWLNFLLSEITKTPVIAAVGSWKLEQKSLLKRLAKRLEYAVQSTYYHLAGKTDHALGGKGNDYYYLRSHCALYRMDLIRKYKLTFSAEMETAGKVMHRRLEMNGYKLVFIPPEVLGIYMLHLNHATMVLHPELRLRGKNRGKDIRRIRKGLKRVNAEQILAEDTLEY